MSEQDDFHIPFAASSREPAATQVAGPAELPTREDLTPRPAPVGLSRADRKDWARLEGKRIADLQATVPSLRKAGLPIGPPRKLNRAGKREWRDANRDNQAAKRKAERDSTSGERAWGALILAGALVVGYFIVRALIGGDDEPGTPAAAPAPVTTQAPAPATTTWAPDTTPAAAAASRDVTAAETAALAWFTITCPLREDQWAPARPLMTEAAWDQVHQSPPVVQATWTCAALNVEQTRYQFEPGIVSLHFEAHRTITTGTTPEVTERVQFTRNLVQQGGTWLVDEQQAD